ncbi:UDP-3-O-[3-hydroxymyristoyl] glucosamine N-acyltransferase [Desulfovibrio litoralis DSM 11393]|uniref:UDP-3-O-acylglucosamine N-acyltransferase n=2 Tax=Desulfovibrio litoralis TaxID=466107 RepID=A0A1M7SN87_9BACT|nr:UDP-3-O-[3-hydroxymyristoyl] glucosamine N-acyltransferase [Desulfovibrio litoralis DSM 11393]
MEFTLKFIADKMGLELKGDDCIITGLNTLEVAGPQDISFLANPKYISSIETTKAGAVVISPEYAHLVKRAIISSNPYFDFAKLLTFFSKPQGSFQGISPQAYIHPEAELAEDVTVYPFAYVGAKAKIGKGSCLFSGVYIGEDCKVGDNCIIYPNAVLMASVELGSDSIIQGGVVLGADGFGFVPNGDNIFKIPQIGKVSIGKRVEIGANATIDRAALDYTTVGDDTKIDNLVQIGHNCKIGNACLIVALVGISGSTKVGNRVTLAGQAGLSGHLSIGDDVTVGPQSGVAKDIPSNSVVGGSPAMDKRDFLRNAIIAPKLPEMYNKIKGLEKEVAELKALVQTLANK